MQRTTFPGSTALSGASYEEDRQELTVTFKSGRGYTYHQVPPDVWEQLQSADSPGTFWRESIKDAYS
mgnify:CR=1 FL=1